MPARVRRAYAEFQEKAHGHDSGSLGRNIHHANKHTTRGPQSMMTTSLLMRAWVVQMKNIAVQPRILADNLQLLCTGPNRLKLFGNGFAVTHEHLEDIGATIAPERTMTFSTDAATREWLRTQRWRRIGREGGCNDGLQGPWSTLECYVEEVVW